MSVVGISTLWKRTKEIERSNWEARRRKRNGREEEREEERRGEERSK